MTADLFLRIPALIVALTFHEYAHAFVADALGDRTPRFTGRLTLNPIAHIDPVGIISLLVFRFGWAKPVQVNPYSFRNPRQGMVLVGIAGPAMNFIMALLSMWIYRTFVLSPGAIALARMLTLYNIWLLVFNIIPVPPLDGYRVLSGLLPWRMSQYLETMESKGWMILLVLVWTGVIGRIMYPLELAVVSILQGVIGLLVP